MSVLGSVLALLGVAATVVRPKAPRDEVEKELVDAKLAIGGLEQELTRHRERESALLAERVQLMTDLVTLRRENDWLQAERSSWQRRAVEYIGQMSNMQLAQQAQAFQMHEQMNAQMLQQNMPAAFGQLNDQQMQQLANFGLQAQALRPHAFERFCNCVPARHDVLRNHPNRIEG